MHYISETFSLTLTFDSTGREWERGQWWWWRWRGRRLWPGGTGQWRRRDRRGGTAVSRKTREICERLVMPLEGLLWLMTVWLCNLMLNWSYNNRCFYCLKNEKAVVYWLSTCQISKTVSTFIDVVVPTLFILLFSFLFSRYLALISFLANARTLYVSSHGCICLLVEQRGRQQWWRLPRWRGWGNRAGKLPDSPRRGQLPSRRVHHLQTDLPR